MKYKFALAGLMGLVFMFTIGVTVASGQTGLSGTWILDKSKSTELPPVLKELSMTIVQKGTKINVSAKLVSDTGTETRDDAFLLDAGAQGVMLDGPNKSSAKGKRTSKTIDRGFESVDEGTFTPAGGPGAVTVKTSRKWQLSADGKTLILDLTRASEMGTRLSHRVFNRA
jgi:hypothetical protein